MEIHVFRIYRQSALALKVTGVIYWVVYNAVQHN